MTNPPRATIDFETKSALKIKECGAWLYSKHRTTRVACLAFLLPGDSPAYPSLWHSGYMSARGWVPAGLWSDSPHTLDDLFTYIRSGGIIEAHNSFFERCIWHHIFSKPTPVDCLGVPDYSRGVNAPEISELQWRCSAAKAATYTLPRDLEKACEAFLPEVRKDTEGEKIMKKLCKPRARRKRESPEHDYYWLDEDLHIRLFEYCRQDVRAEHALSEALPDLSPSEYKVWLADQRANWRGVRVDTELCEAALYLDTETKLRLNEELTSLTGITAGTQRARILAWLSARGLVLDDSQAPTLEWAIDCPEFASRPPEVQRVVHIARDVNKTSTSKYAKILSMVDPEDGRVRELMMYHGATTGRWAGKGIQVQNFPRGLLNGDPPWNLGMQEACEYVLSRDYDRCAARFGNVLNLLSSCARGALIPSEGTEFISADYSAIEARVVFWLAGADHALEIYRQGKDLYCDMAGTIYRREITKADKKERQFGKTTILGLGFGVGFLTFALNLRKEMRFTEAEVRSIVSGKYAQALDWVHKKLYPQKEHFEKAENPINAYKEAVLASRIMHKRIKVARADPDEMLPELALCKYVVDMYRARFKEVPDLWKMYEESAAEAVRNPGVPVQAGFVTWCFEGRFLNAYLPSGRALHYCDPRLKPLRTPWGQIKEQLHYMGVHKKTKQWVEMHTYGASETENVTQAVARDIMAHALVKADESNLYTPILSVHDELLNEIAKGQGVVLAFEQFMADAPPEYAGCPIAAEGGIMMRFQK